MQVVINSPGTSLIKKAGVFELRNRSGKQKLSPQQVDSILITAGAKISSDAVLLAIAFEIDILFLDGRGQPQGRIWSHRYGSIASLRKQQVVFSASLAGAQWVAALLARRLHAAGKLLQSLQGGAPDRRERVTRAVAEIEKYRQRILDSADRPLDTDIKGSWRGWEGSASRHYFQTLSYLLPPEYTFKSRSRRPAKDAFNCALNYAYGILYGRIEIALILAGIDPYMGVFHRDEYNRPVLVYDLIEAYRRWADRIVTDLCLDRQLTAEMFQAKGTGLWLSEKGKALLIPYFNAFLEKSEAPAGSKQVSRLAQIQVDCYELAQAIRKS